MEVALRSDIIDLVLCLFGEALGTPWRVASKKRLLKTVVDIRTASYLTPLQSITKRMSSINSSSSFRCEITSVIALFTYYLIYKWTVSPIQITTFAFVKCNPHREVTLPQLVLKAGSYLCFSFLRVTRPPVVSSHGLGAGQENHV